MQLRCRWRELSLLFAVAVAPTSAQNDFPSKSAKEVFESYRKMDAEGARLTTKGWYEASGYFVKPGREPQRIAVAVIDAGERIADPPVHKGDTRLEFWSRCGALGQIDPSGRFTSVTLPFLIDPSGHLVENPEGQVLHGPHLMDRVHELVLTDTHWEFAGANHKELRQVTGQPEWRIETFEFEPLITIDAAIRYLTSLRDSSRSLAIKANADKSIVALRRLKVTPRVQRTK